MSTAPTGNVSQLISNSTSDNSKKTANSTLGKDDFLKILITQLQNQDPSHPLEDKEFIAQMAQFTSVEQLTNMTTQLTALRQSLGLSPGLIGKEISWNSTDSTGTSTIKSGVVDALSFKNGVQYAGVNGEEVTLDQITEIKNPE
jgi:flagellar basal-body rod modification protein FlgD